MPNELGIAKRNLTRSRLLCRHIGKHLEWIYEHYADDHPDFCESVFTAAHTAKELDDFLGWIHEQLCSM